MTCATFLPLLAFYDNAVTAPLVVFVLFMGGVWWALTLMTNRTTHAEDRLERLGRPKSLAEIDLDGGNNKDKFAGLKEAATSLGSPLQPHTELERNNLRMKLSHAGFRSGSALGVYQGLRMVCLLGFAVPAVLFFGVRSGFTFKSMQLMVLCAGVGFYLPSIVLWYLRTRRQKEIFLTLPDALDLMVVCVESGLGLDAAMRRVTDEMKGHSRILCEEFALANLQLQMGRPRRDI